jgi:hypothetical protein
LIRHCLGGHLDARETEIQGETKKKPSEENEQTGENGVTSITTFTRAQI